MEPDLQRKSDDRYQCHQLSPGEPQRPSPKRYAFLTNSLGKRWKVLGTVWRPTPTILIVVRTQPESSVNTLSVIQGIDQRICPTVVYVTLEDFEDTLHQVVGKNQQLFACTVNEHAGNRTDRKFDTRLRFSQ